jgi:hypothetical protein
VTFGRHVPVVLIPIVPDLSWSANIWLS